MNTLLKSYIRKFLTKHLLFILAILLFLLLIAGMSFGAVKLNFSEAVREWAAKDFSGKNYRILVHSRLPRVLAAMLCGLALAVSGVILQSVLANPLAAPNIIGVNSGAGFAVYLALALFPATRGLIPVAAFLGAFAASLVVSLLSLRAAAGKITIVLAGVAVSSILNAGMDSLITLCPDMLVNASIFKIGGFYGISMASLQPAWIYIIAGLAAALLLARRLDVLILGDDIAASLGMNVRLVRTVSLLAAAVLAGAAVSFSGLIGFVGLIVPNAVRRLTGNEHTRLVPAAALLGACFVIFCDILCRTLFAPYEIPVGIMMSFLGGPFFLCLLLKKKGVPE